MVAESDAKVKFLPMAFGMYHMGRVSVEYRDGMTYDVDTQVRIDQSLIEKGRTDYIMSKLRFTDDERKKLRSGLDLFFTKGRLIEMFGNRVIAA